MNMRPNFLSEANYNAAQAAIAAAAIKRAAAFSVVEKCLSVTLKVLFVFILAFSAGYCVQRLYEYCNKLKFLEIPANGDDEYYAFTFFASFLVGVLGLLRVLDQKITKLTVTNLVKLVGVRNFIILLISHLWTEFAINRLRSLTLVTITSLIYSIFVIDIGIDQFALDTGLVEASLIVSIRFITDFWERKKETQTDAELIVARISFVMNISVCLIAYVLKWISPANYDSLEVFVTHQKLHELEVTITDLKEDLADLRNQVDRRRTKPAKPNDPNIRENLRYRKS